MEKDCPLLFVISFLSILFCGCDSYGKKQPVRQEEPESTADTLIRESSQKSLEIIEHDSLPPNNHYSFSFNDMGAIYSESRGELYISGFAADDQEHFYFAAGNPIMITAYHRDVLEWQHVVSERTSVLGLFKLIRDSLYLFEEEPAQIIRMATSGIGATDTLRLPLKRITGGRCLDNQYFLWDSVEWRKDVLGHRRYCTLRTFEYPNHLLREKAPATIHDFPTRLKMETDLASQLRDLHVGDCAYNGSTDGYHIYTSRFYGDCTVIIVPENEKQIHLFPVQDMPMLNVCVSPTESLPVINRDYDILCNGSLYILGYNRHPTGIILSQIDIHQLIQQITAEGSLNPVSKTTTLNNHE